MNKSFTWSFAVALAGFLFGFDTAVISGVEDTLQRIWQLSDWQHGFWVMSSALWGTVLGAVFGKFPTDKYGRKNTLFFIGIFFFVSAVGSALATNYLMFAFFRFIGGLAVGASTIAAPAYITEISPAAKRGQMVALYQLSIVCGILIAFLSNYFMANSGWQWMIGIEALPALIYSGLVWFLPESPRWLFSMGKTKEATKSMELLQLTDSEKQLILHPTTNEFDALIPPQSETTDTIFSKKYRIGLALVFFIAFFNQFSGINAILYYSKRIFIEAGFEQNAAFLGSVGIGLCNLLFTLLGMKLIDVWGRKKLMYIGSVGYIVSLFMVALAFFYNWSGYVSLTFLCLFIASHAIGQGTVIWVFIAELFPNRLRASGQAVGSSVHWVLAAIIPLLMPLALNQIGGGGIFLFFGVMMVFQLLWVHFKMPETKGISLEELSKKISR
ncbi:MAG: sugar porter family MFS transporter [Flavobacteriales bacterium]|nr:sugar porter family MFS transporter [Flavobacteriales bacterium]